MPGTTSRRQGVLGLSLVVLVVIFLAVIRTNGPDPVRTGQAATPPQDASHAQPAPPTAYSPLPTPSPTPTIPDVPTPLPTPVVTRVPVAEPPFIPAPGEPQPYTLVFREGDLIQRLRSDETEAHLIVDVHQATGLHLGQRSTWVNQWGAASPDGRQLAVVLTDVGDPAQMYKGQVIQRSIQLLDLQSGQLRPLLENAAKPVWSPDGARIAYFNTQTRGLDIVTVADGSTRAVFAVDPASEHQADWFTWAPDGQRMAVVKTWGGVANVGGVWIVDLAGPTATQVVDMEMNAARLSWSPAGDRISFLSSVGEHRGTNRARNIWTVNPDNGSVQRITNDMNLGTTPIWSSDGNWIVFSGTNGLEGESYQYDIWSVMKDGSSIKRWIDDAVSDSSPQWAPGGTKIVFSKGDAGIWEIDVQSGEFRQIYAQEVSFVLVKQVTVR